MYKRYLAAVAFAAIAGAAPVQAATIGGGVVSATDKAVGGTFVLLDGSSTFDVGNNNHNKPDLFAFDEKQNVLLTSDVRVNIGDDAPSGAYVSSHYVFFDPKGSTSSGQKGYVDFDGDIYGIITKKYKLSISDYLGSDTVTYKSPNLRGLESVDSVWIDPTKASRLWVDWRAGSPGDYIRVLTSYTPPPVADLARSVATVPLPAGLPLLGAALGAFGIVGRKRRRKA